MTFFYLLLIVHISIGLLCAHLVKSTRFNSESWFVAGTLFGGLGLFLCWLCVTDWKRSPKHGQIASAS